MSEYPHENINHLSGAHENKLRPQPPPPPPVEYNLTDIDVIKDYKAHIQKEIADLLQEFSERAGLEVTGISVQILRTNKLYYHTVLDVKL